MKETIKNLAQWLVDQGVGVAQDILEEKLQEAYDQVRIVTGLKYTEEVAFGILDGVRSRVEREKLILYEKDFYCVPPEEDIIQMKAYDQLLVILGKIVSEYTNFPERYKLGYSPEFESSDKMTGETME